MLWNLKASSFPNLSYVAVCTCCAICMAVLVELAERQDHLRLVLLVFKHSR